VGRKGKGVGFFGWWVERGCFGGGLVGKGVGLFWEGMGEDGKKRAFEKKGPIFPLLPILPSSP
jgi:hypothetical protein